jgi:hypothetical protein
MTITLSLVRLDQLVVSIIGLFRSNSPPKVVPAYSVESMKDSAGFVLAAIQIQSAVKIRSVRYRLL